MLVKENLSGRKGPNNVVLNPKDGYFFIFPSKCLSKELTVLQ